MKSISLRIFLCAFLMLLIQDAKSQDMHFTMFDLAPLELNPANTGYFAGTFRIGGLYRTQWQGLSITSDGFNGGGNFSGFQTPSAFIDVPFGIPKKGNAGGLRNWVGAGVSFYMDRVSQLSNLSASLSLAYHLGLGMQGNTIISFGLQGGIAQYRIVDPTQLVFEDAILASGGGVVNPTLTSEVISNSNVTLPDFSGGIMVTHRSSKLGINGGISLNHFTSPEFSFLGGESRLPMTLISSFIMEYELTDKIQIKPLLLFHNQLTPADGTQGGFSSYEFNFQVLGGYHFNEEKDITAYFGAGYRIFDAAIIRVGLDIKGFQFGFAYDINTNTNGLSSSVFNNNNRGMAFEVALSYIAKLYKVPVVRDVLFCPRF